MSLSLKVTTMVCFKQASQIYDNERSLIIMTVMQNCDYQRHHLMECMIHLKRICLRVNNSNLLYSSRCRRRAQNLLRNPSHPVRAAAFRSVKTRADRLKRNKTKQFLCWSHNSTKLEFMQ